MFEYAITKTPQQGFPVSTGNVNVGSRFQECFHHVHISNVTGDMQCSPFSMVAYLIHIGSCLQQSFHHCHISLFTGFVKSCLVAVFHCWILIINVKNWIVVALLEHGFNCFYIALTSRLHKCGMPFILLFFSSCSLILSSSSLLSNFSSPTLLQRKPNLAFFLLIVWLVSQLLWHHFSCNCFAVGSFGSWPPCCAFSLISFFIHILFLQQCYLNQNPTCSAPLGLESGNSRPFTLGLCTWYLVL